MKATTRLEWVQADATGPSRQQSPSHNDTRRRAVATDRFHVQRSYFACHRWGRSVPSARDLAILASREARLGVCSNVASTRRCRACLPCLPYRYKKVHVIRKEWTKRENDRIYALLPIEPGSLKLVPSRILFRPVHRHSRAHLILVQHRGYHRPLPIHLLIFSL